MNKKFAIAVALLIISIVCCAGCIDPQDPVDPITPVDPVDPITPVDPEVPELPVEEYSVMFMMNYDGAGAYTAETVKAGDTVSMPASPSRSGYTFDGWFTEADGGVVYDFTQAVNEDTMLYAQWSKKKSSSSGSSHTHHYEPTVVDPTCVDRGYTTYAPCSCGATKADDTFTEPTGEHSYETGEKDGQTGVLCSGCNDFQSSGILIGDTLYDTFAEAMDAAEYTNEVDMITLIGGVESVDVTQDVIIDLNGQEANLNYPEGTDAESIKILKSGSENLVTVKIGTKVVEFDPVISGKSRAIVTEDYLIVASVIDTEDSETGERFGAIYTAHGLIEFGKIIDGAENPSQWNVILKNDIDLGNVLFNPIGSYRFEKSFMGTFDGNGKTISGLSQNTWELDNGYYYNDCGLGLFGAVEEATIKNLIIDGADISGESAICGTIAAVAHNTTFQNITIKNAKVMDYQYYSGGIIGWASGICNFIDCNVNASTTVGAQWGDFDNSIGGVIGGASTSSGSEILMKDCIVACRIDAYNDVTSSYKWSAYRRAGMLIGNSGATEKIGDTTYAFAPQLTCENVKVTYGDWANYHYCKFTTQPIITSSDGKTTDPNNWPYVRCEAGVSNGAYSNPRYGVATDSNGDKIVNENGEVNDNHVHNEGEDHNILYEFDQLYGGGQGVYGTATHEGVTVVYNNK